MLVEELRLKDRRGASAAHSLSASITSGLNRAFSCAVLFCTVCVPRTES